MPRTPKIKTQKIPIPGTNQALSIDVEVVESSKMPGSLKKQTNVAKVSIGGKSFYLVAGKTHLTTK
jgi:hypothetical protein